MNAGHAHDLWREMKYREHLPWSADGDDMWVFGYGSLMWKPEFPHAEIRDACLYGYHRALCIYSTAYRGTPEQPGLVFGLDTGGSCRGRALRVAAQDIDAVVEYLYSREMITNVYRPVMGATRIADIGRVRALVFVADSSHVQYAGALSDLETARLVAQGNGPAGACIEYVRSTLDHLRELGVKDHRLGRVLELAEAEASKR
ncbi:MAG: gamma-glutamylcyclotransferase [Rhodospirillales bacterium]